MYVVLYNLLQNLDHYTALQLHFDSIVHIPLLDKHEGLSQAPCLNHDGASARRSMLER